MRITTTRSLLTIATAAGALLLAGSPPAAPMPRLMDLYNEHPRSLPQHRDKCVICHVNADGSGRLTPFGERYEHVGLSFSEELMREYGNLFAPASGTARSATAGPATGASKASSGAAAASIPAAAGPGAAPPVLRAGAPAASAVAPNETAAQAVPSAAAPESEWSVTRYYRAECQKCHGKYGDGDPLQGVPAWANRKWIQERMPQTEELFRILMKGKDKMVGHEGKITDEQGRELLEHVKAIAVQYGS
jgi:hypothetical protein